MDKRFRPLPALLAASLLLAPCTAFAQVTNQWQFGAQLYAFLPALEGTANFPASDTTPSVSVDADTLLENLNFVFFGNKR